MSDQDKRDKVIKGLECCVIYVNCAADGGCPYNSQANAKCLNTAIKDAIALLKAQEPMKPTRYQEGRWFKTWRCGACGGTLVFRNGEDKLNYCTDCGRAVKWE